jgi:hypothetical protein
MIRSQLLPSNLLNLHRPGSPGGGASGSGAQIVLGNPGRCPHEPTLVTFLFDNSGSVSSGNDPIGNRYVEAKLAVGAIARRCRCGHELCAVIHFDVPTSSDVPPTTLDRNGLATIERGLTIPTDGGGISMLRPSLKRAYQIAAQYPDHHHTLVIASDFEVFDNDLPTLLDEVCAYPGGNVHAVVLRADPPAALLDDDRVTVTRIGYGEAPGAVAKALFAGLIARRRHREQRNTRVPRPTREVA